MTSRARQNYLLMGMSIAAAAVPFATSGAYAARFTTLYQFTNGTDGETPVGGVVQDSVGVLYGTTASGGDPSCHTDCTDDGTLYSFSNTAGLKTLVYFDGPNGGDPQNTLLLSGTTLYGTAGGGANNDGVIFAVHTDGTDYTLLHQFNGTDGENPVGTPRFGAGGNLYGITYAGGAYGDGVLFSIAPSGTYTILHNFTGGSDGGNPNSLLIDATGTLFGSTAQGGAISTCLSPYGCGAVFSYAPETGQFAVKYAIQPGNTPNPLLGSIGPGPTIYGTTAGLDVNTIFALGPSGFTTIANIPYLESGEQFPGPTLAPDGSLLLTVGRSNYGGDGNLFRFKNGVMTGVSFSGGRQGGSPSGQPIVSSTGAVIGTTDYNGACYECGTIYQVAP